MTASMDATFEAIREKVERAERLSAADGEFLLRPEVDLHRVGELADAVRRRMAGEVVFYNVNAHLNPTNVCFYRCALCAYSRDPDDPRAFVMSDEQMLAVAREAAASGATELHIVGGVHPGMEFAWYRDIIARLHEAQPGLHLKAWTAVEIDWFAQQTGRPARAVLEELMRHGLGSLPGGGAEILDPEVRSEICPRKADAETWLAVHRGAHSLGLPTNATMLFGHIESHEHRVDHLLRLRHLQDETGGFQAFVPLVFHPENTRLGHVEKTSADDVLRTVAVSRLMLDNIPHIKAYWVSLGLGVAQTALSYGANDLDGTVRREQIHHAAGATSPDVLGVEQLRALIAETGRRPVERDSLYRPV